MALAVESGLEPKALSGWHGLAGSVCQDGGVPSEYWKVAYTYQLYCCIIPTRHLLKTEIWECEQ